MIIYIIILLGDVSARSTHLSIRTNNDTDTSLEPIQNKLVDENEHGDKRGGINIWIGENLYIRDVQADIEINTRTRAINI